MRRILAPALVLLAASQAGAIESLVGTYDAKLTCRGLELGVRSQQKIVGTMRLIDLGEGALELDFQSGGERVLSDVPLLAIVIPEVAKPERGRANGLACNSGAGKLSAVALSADVVTKTGSDKADLKGTLVIVGSDEASQVCSLRAKRTSTETPALELEAECAAAIE
jgi:hypothetical protein